MFFFLYSTGFRIYILGVRFAALFTGKARKWIEGRKEPLDQTIQFPARVSRRVWFHVSSLGEFEQAQPVMEAWKRECPTDLILLSFFSPSGYEHAASGDHADAVFYLPFDLSKPVNEALDYLQPDLFVLVKYDFWPNLLRALIRRNIPIVLISGLFRKNHYLFRWWAAPVLDLLRSFKALFVQDEGSASQLHRRGIHEVIVAGDTRIDRVFGIKNETGPEIDGLHGHQVIMGGSTWPAEEKMLSGIWKSAQFASLKEHWRLVLAPHDLSENHIKSIEELFGEELIRLSRWTASDQEKSVLLIDRIGLLSRLYRFADIAVIGGGFGKGIHNILEPAVYGVSILFGPRWKRFREAADFIANGGAYEFRDNKQLQKQLFDQIGDPDLRKSTGESAHKCLDRSRGATSLIIKELMERI